MAIDEEFNNRRQELGNSQRGQDPGEWERLDRSSSSGSKTSTGSIRTSSAKDRLWASVSDRTLKTDAKTLSRKWSGDAKRG